MILGWLVLSAAGRMLKLGAKKAVFETLTLAQMIRHNFATKKPQFNGIGRLSNWP